jgi:two-component system sensor histidine kinase BaeS
LPRLFDRFWRGEKSRTRAAGGAGLGLAIARQLVEAQQGTIAADNQPGGGLRVAVRLPN